MNEVQVTITGNLTDDPKQHRFENGDMVVNFSVAHTVRRFNRDTQAYEDGDTSYYRVKAFRKLAENILASFRKGQRVIVLGTLAERKFTDSDGNARTIFEVTAQEVGASVLFRSTATAQAAQQPPLVGAAAAQSEQQVAVAPQQPQQYVQQQQPQQQYISQQLQQRQSGQYGSASHVSPMQAPLADPDAMEW